MSTILRAASGRIETGAWNAQCVNNVPATAAELKDGLDSTFDNFGGSGDGVTAAIGWRRVEWTLDALTDPGFAIARVTVTIRNWRTHSEGTGLVDEQAASYVMQYSLNGSSIGIVAEGAGATNSSLTMTINPATGSPFTVAEINAGKWGWWTKSPDNPPLLNDMDFIVSEFSVDVLFSSTRLATLRSTAADLADALDSTYERTTYGPPETDLSDLAVDEVHMEALATAGTPGLIAYVRAFVRTRYAGSFSPTALWVRITTSAGTISVAQTALTSAFAEYQSGEQRTDPAGAAWTWATVNAISAGIRVTGTEPQGTTGYVDVADVWLEVWGAQGLLAEGAGVAGAVTGSGVAGTVVGGGIAGPRTGRGSTIDFEGGGIVGGA